MMCNETNERKTKMSIHVNNLQLAKRSVKRLDQIAGDLSSISEDVKLAFGEDSDAFSHVESLKNDTLYTIALAEYAIKKDENATKMEAVNERMEIALKSIRDIFDELHDRNPKVTVGSCDLIMMIERWMKYGLDIE